MLCKQWAHWCVSACVILDVDFLWMIFHKYDTHSPLHLCEQWNVFSGHKRFWNLFHSDTEILLPLSGHIGGSSVGWSPKNFFPQSLQWKCFSPMWIRWWTLRSDFMLNLFPHSLHSNSFLFAWQTWWCSSIFLFLKLFFHKCHIHKTWQDNSFCDFPNWTLISFHNHRNYEPFHNPSFPCVASKFF